MMLLNSSSGKFVRSHRCLGCRRGLEHFNSALGFNLFSGRPCPAPPRPAHCAQQPCQRRNKGCKRRARFGKRWAEPPEVRGPQQPQGAVSSQALPSAAPLRALSGLPRGQRQWRTQRSSGGGIQLRRRAAAQPSLWRRRSQRRRGAVAVGPGAFPGRASCWCWAAGPASAAAGAQRCSVRPGVAVRTRSEPCFERLGESRAARSPEPGRTWNRAGGSRGRLRRCDGECRGG